MFENQDIDLQTETELQDNFLGIGRKKDGSKRTFLGSVLAATPIGLAATALHADPTRKADRIERKALKAEQKATRKLTKSQAIRAQSKQRTADTISYLAQRDDLHPADVALQVVSNNPAPLQAYVQSKGEQPLENPAELATQAYMLRQNDVQQVSDLLDIPQDHAELMLDEQDGEEYLNEDNDDSTESWPDVDGEEFENDSYTGKPDNFIEDIWEAVKPIAQLGVEKIAASKAKKGKKAPIWNALNKGLNGGVTQSDNSDTSLQGVATEAYNKIVAQKKKEEIKKMLPYIIGGVVLLILATVLITRSVRRK